MEKTLQRNQIWDFFKGIFAIGVVFVHFPFPGVAGKILASVGAVLASFAVSAAIVGILGRCKRQSSNDGVK